MNVTAFTQTSKILAPKKQNSATETDK